MWASIIFPIVSLGLGVGIGCIYGREKNRDVLTKLSANLSILERSYAKLHTEVEDARKAIFDTAAAFNRLKPINKK